MRSRHNFNALWLVNKKLLKTKVGNSLATGKTRQQSNNLLSNYQKPTNDQKSINISQQVGTGIM
jgi:hypothetical protein